MIPEYESTRGQHLILNSTSLTNIVMFTTLMVTKLTMIFNDTGIMWKNEHSTLLLTEKGD